MLKASKKPVISKELVGNVKIAIVRSAFNSAVTEKLEDACVNVLEEAGVKQIEKWLVPGALEIPIMASKVAERGKVDVIIALGAVIKGATYHFEIVANESARGCADVSLDYGIPVINGIICAYNEKQAKERAGNNNKNKGRECAYAALEMASLIEGFNEKGKGKSR